MCRRICVSLSPSRFFLCNMSLDSTVNSVVFHFSRKAVQARKIAALSQVHKFCRLYFLTFSWIAVPLQHAGKPPEMKKCLKYSKWFLTTSKVHVAFLKKMHLSFISSECVHVYLRSSILGKVLLSSQSFHTDRAWWSDSNFINIFRCFGCVKPSLQILAFSITAWQLLSEVWKHRLVFFSIPLVLSLITGLGKSKATSWA